MPKRKCWVIPPQELEKSVQAYFALCSQQEMRVKGDKEAVCCKPPTMEGLAAYLHLCKRTLYRYMAGEYPSRHAKQRQFVAECIERARDRISAQTIEGAMLGHYDTRISTMVLNGMGYGAQPEATAPEPLRVEWQGVQKKELKEWAE